RSMAWRRPSRIVRLLEPRGRRYSRARPHVTGTTAKLCAHRGKFDMEAVKAAGGRAAKATGVVLFTLAAGQFVMALDTTVMNTAIATVAKDVGTTVTGIPTAITLYTLVMASLMIAGGKVGELLGRKRAFAIGCAIYSCGSLTTALSQNL